jgi:hypothetical protein
MKRKAVKITDSTLFVYKQNGQNLSKSETDTTTTITTTGHTTGIFNSEKNRR